MNCKKCNNTLSSGVNFCEKCGTKLEIYAVAKKINKKHLYISLIIASLVHLLTYPFVDILNVVINFIFISLLASVATLVYFLLYKLSNKKIESGKSLKNFTVTFCVVVFIMFVPLLNTFIQEINNELQKLQ